jgi:hypothetical protein
VELKIIPKILGKEIDNISTNITSYEEMIMGSDCVPMPCAALLAR